MVGVTEVRLRRTIKEELNNSEPAISFDELLDKLDVSEDQAVPVIEAMLVEGELNDDIFLWRGGAGHSSRSTS